MYPPALVATLNSQLSSGIKVHKGENWKLSCFQNKDNNINAKSDYSENKNG